MDNWLCDLEMDDYDFFSNGHKKTLEDGEFLSHDIACALQGQNFQPSLSTGSYSSHHTSKTDKTSFDQRQPTKQLKTNSSCNSSITEHYSPSTSSPQLLSFENSIHILKTPLSFMGSSTPT